MIKSCEEKDEEGRRGRKEERERQYTELLRKREIKKADKNGGTKRAERESRM